MPSKSKLLITAILILLLCTSSCQNNRDLFFGHLVLDTKNAYLVFRGTDTKEGYFARDFNIKDTLSSHVGIAIYSDEVWSVYHVLENKNTPNDFNKDTFKNFLNKKQDEVFYYSIWELTTLTDNKIDTLKHILNQYESKQVIFDRSFGKDSKKLYCSEFVCEVLSTVDSSMYNFKYFKRDLRGIYKKYFNKDTLEYYPVDMFMYNQNFNKIHEWIGK